MEGPQYAVEALQGQKMPLYVRLKRRRDEPPPPFLCVLPPQKRQQLPDGTPGRLGVLEHALIFKHVDSAPPPVTGVSPEVLPSQLQPDEILQPSHARYTETAEGGIVSKTGPQSYEGNACGSDQESDVKETSPRVENTTFWSAFNAPLRSDVFGSFAGAVKASPSHLGYRDAVEEAVKSLRRFRVDNHWQRGSSVSAQQNNVVLREGSAVQVLDVYQDGNFAATDSSCAGQEGDEFEYDLYAMECGSGSNYSWEAAVAPATRRQRLLELLEQDRSAVALVEVEDVDGDTGVVTNRNSSMQVFLEEFGDIDDSDSDEGGEIDYPSGESSDDGGRRPTRRMWESESSGTASDRSKSEEEVFDDDYF